MAAVNPRIGIPLTQIPRAIEEMIEPVTPGRHAKRRRVSAPARVLDVEDSHLRVARTGHQRLVVGMRHELDGEDIRTVARQQGGIEGEGRGRGLRLIGIEVEIGIVRTCLLYTSDAADEEFAV